MTLRPITPQDMDFLYGLYYSTREDELAMTGWDQAQKDAFVQMQFNAQHTHYQQHYQQAAYDVILLDDERVGRLYVDRRDDEIEVIDIAIAKEYRNRGIGTAWLTALFEEGRQTGKRVSIYVEQNNPARRLYERLGFQYVGGLQGIYHRMEWSHEQQEA